ncbi:Vignain [Platanthera zijinensis]|uniref:Vignain n=1 Tax=Platanthera zijinensis TaxID=2320716 RepID=A0AAP0G1A6_9ASPA
MIQKNGITFESVYSYTTIEGKCIIEQNSSLVFIDGYKKVRANENSLLKAVANQHVSVAIDSLGFDFEDYYGGVFVQNNGTNLDHEMMVGYYTNKHGIKYWILRNSWEPIWREGGYMRMLRGASNPQELCGMATDVY